MNNDPTVISFIVLFYAVGALGMFTAIRFLHMCRQTPTEVDGFCRGIPSVQKGIGYYIQTPLGRILLDGRDYSDPAHRVRRCALRGVWLLLTVGFFTPIFLTLANIIPWSFLNLTRDSIATIYTIIGLCSLMLALACIAWFAAWGRNLSCSEDKQEDHRADSL